MKLVTYNIHSGIGTDGRFDLARVGSVLEDIGADIAALQEVGDFRGRTGAVPHPETLARQLGLQLAFGPNVIQDGRPYGNAILTRLPIVRSRNYDLTVHRREPRGALRCDLDLGEGRLLHVFCLHLGLAVKERRRQESLLLSSDILQDASRRDPVIVCGDFNYRWDGRLPPLLREAFDDADQLLHTSHRTYPSRLPLFRLDRIFVDEGVQPRRVSSHRTAQSRVASDHLPLVMEFQVSAPLAVEGDTHHVAPVELFSG